MADPMLLLAQFIAPISAVGITLWYQRRDRVFQRKLDVFRTLMRYRKDWLNPDWVGALNMIPVEFSKDGRIMASFSALLDRLHDPAWNDEGSRQRVYELAETNSVELLSRISKNIKIDLGELDLRSRIYAPIGWTNEQLVAKSLRDEALKLVRGENVLQVRVSQE